MKEYFSHDYNPTNDPKIQALIGVYGAIGYGVYWRLIEMLHCEKSHNIEQKKYIYIAIGKQLFIDEKQVSDIINSCINDFELFDSDGNVFWCNRVNRNLEIRTNISESRSKAGKASAERRKQISTSVEQVSTSVEQNSTSVEQNSTNVNKEKKIKEKEKEKKEKEKKEDIIARDKKFISEISKHKEKYHKNTLNSFYLYWSEKTPNGDKMKFELQDTFEISKRLATWNANNNKFGNNQTQPQPSEKQFSLKNYDIPHSDLFGYTNKDLIQRCKDGLYKEIQS